MKFEYFAGEQRSPEWFKLRQGKVTASRLSDWLAVSKAEKTKGAPLKPRKDYERELMYERQFKTSYNVYVSPAMEDGIDYESFALAQYETLTGLKTRPVGAWFNEHFVASPDAAVTEKKEEGLVEVKVVRDNTFSEILQDGVPDRWWKQIQGELFGSTKKWCDFVALNLNTQKIKIIRVFPDPEFFEWLEIAIPEELTVDPYDLKDVHDVAGEIPAAEDIRADSEFNF